MDAERNALSECESCHVVYGSEPLECHICGETAFTYIGAVRTKER